MAKLAKLKHFSHKNLSLFTQYLRAFPSLFKPTATASATATVAEVFPPTATASATAQKSTYGRPLVNSDTRKERWVDGQTEVEVEKVILILGMIFLE